MGAKVGIDLGPRRLGRAGDIFGAFAIGNPLGVRQGVEGSAGGFALNGGFAASPGAGVVHGEDFQEDLTIPLRVAGRRHEHAQDGCTDQNERLAPPPLTEAGQGLAGTRLALLVGLGGEAGDGELGLYK